MTTRFQYIVAVNTKELVEELNRRALEYWFTVVYMTDCTAIIDAAPALVSPIDESEYTDIQLESDKPAPSFA